MDQYPNHFPSQPGMGGGFPGAASQGVPGTMRPGMGSPGNQAPDLAGATKKGKKGKKERSVTPRVAKQYKIAALVAIVVGAAAWYFTGGQPEPTTYVVTARVPVGALQQVTPNQLAAVPVAPELVEEGAITGDTEQEALAAAAEDLSGTTLYPLAERQQLRVDYFSKNPAVLTEQLEPNERLMSVTASVASSVAGGIRPGDSVDIVAVNTSDGTGSGNIVAADVPVVAVNPAAETLEQVAASQTGENKDVNPSDLLPGTPIPGVYTIRIDADQVTRLAIVDSGAKLYLVYRAPGAEEASTTTPVDVAAVIAEGINGN